MIKNKGIGIIGTVGFHLVLLLLLLYLKFPYQPPQDEEGIMVMIGIENVGADVPNKSVTSSSVVTPQKEIMPVKTEPVKEVKEQLLSQNLEESVNLENEEKKKKEEEERQKRIEEEKRKAEEERLRKEAEERERKERDIKNRVTNVFQNSATEAGSTGTTEAGQHNQGSPSGNSDQGAPKGSAGYGSYDLGGRSITGGLPKPAFSVNESGVVVVNITVNEDGKVISAIVGQGTTTSSGQLRNSALAAAKKALFETKKGVSTQSGTITYKFDSDN